MASPSIMAKYCFSQLSLPTSSIRLLRLLPSERDVKSLQGELFEYRLRNSDKASYPYEALSYVWGGDEKPQSISIGNLNLDITQNLYTALLHLRDHDCSRILWVDAVCINQEDDEEKQQQIPLMAEIYAKALRVVVWLGEAKDDSDRALEEIRIAGEKSAGLSNAKSTEETIRQLLERPWFRRIWVLQEMAAAQHVQIIYGSTEIDGHAFCLGLDSLGTIFEDIGAQVTFLIRGAIFRSGNISRKHGRLSLDICSLGELLDMYHAHGATKQHDKVYALLGMCSDDLSAAGLKPDYSLSWKELMQRLVKFLLSDHVSVNASNEKKTAVINSKGFVIGKVKTVEVNNVSGGGQNVEAIITTSPGCRISGSARWLLPTSAKSIQKEDLICFLQGSLKPTIVRLQEDFFTIVVIAAVPPEHIHAKDGDVKWSELAQSASFIRDFLLVWDWESSLDHCQNNVFRRTNNLQVQDAKAKLENNMDNAIQDWNIAQILGDADQFSEAEERRQKATEFFQVVAKEKHAHSLECHCNQVPLSWAAECGDHAVVGMLLAKENIDPDLKDYSDRTPLSWAAEKGHEAVVKLLLEAKADVESKSSSGRTPLWWAAEKGHEAVVKLLLEAKADVESKSSYGRTPLWWAAEKGHEAVVKLLLEAKADVESKSSGGRTPLSWAAEKGHEAVVKLLLEAKADVESKDSSYGQTPLSWAAEKGHEAVVKLLLEAKADVESKDSSYGQTPLSWAAEKGHEAVVKLLLEAKADVESKDSSYGQTPLSWAAEKGHEAVVKLLLEAKADVESKDSSYGRTPLSWAAEKGHEAVVKLLLEAKADVESKSSYGRTPLSWAAEKGHEAVVKLLLEAKADVESKDSSGGRTPLSWAAEKGHEAVVKLLLEAKADVESKDSSYGRTPLSWAAEKGHEAVVKLLLEAKADVESKDSSGGQTPLSWAAEKGHEAVVKLLLEAKADVESKDSSGGQTPLSWAAEKGHEAVVKLLRSFDSQ